MTNTPRISVLIANFNNGKFFKDCYNSLISQTEKDWEAIIIDDGSTDNSVQIITDMISAEPHFVFYQNEENIGYQKTLIKAVELSRGEIFGRLDPDDALLPEALSMMLEAHEQYPEVGLIYSNVTICDPHLTPRRVRQATQIDSLDEKYYNFNNEIAHFATFKKLFYNLTSGFDSFNKRAEDKDIYMKMCEVAPVKHLDTSLYKYRYHEGGMSTHKNEEKAYFWHIVALVKMAERRNINLEDLFVDKFGLRSDFEEELEKERAKRKNLKNSRTLRILHKLGLIKFYNDL